MGKTIETKALPFLIRKIQWLEKWSRPRSSWVFKRQAPRSIIGIVILIFTIVAFLAPPFSGLDTLPAIGVVLIALSIILEDSLFLLVGTLIGSLGTFLVIGLSTVIVNAVRDLL